MCGRSSLTKTQKEIEQRFNATFYSDDLVKYNPLPNYNVAPSHFHPVITGEDPTHIQLFKWGLIPFWAKDQKIAFKMINARKETLLEKASFKPAVEKRRCIVPLDGFYEWKNQSGQKVPFRIKTTNTEIFSVAGMWEKWVSPEGDDIFTFTLITQEANELVASIHDRMPAILLPEQEKIWLDQDIPVKDLIQMLNPYPADLMEAYEVSMDVNNVRNNQASNIEPHNNQMGKTLDLFN